MPKKPCGGCRPLVPYPAPPSHPPSTHRALPHLGDRMRGEIVRPPCARETTAPARLRIEGAGTHGNGNSSGSTPRSGSEIRKESAEATPRTEQRLLPARGRLDR